VDLFAVDDIERAMNLSADDFKAKYGFTKPLPSGLKVIVYCRSGVRAGQAAKLFTEQFGFTRFVHVVQTKYGLPCCTLMYN